MYFNILKETGQIVGHSETLVKFNDHCLQVELSNITIHETVIDFGNNQTTIQYSYTPDTVDLVGFKKAAVAEISARPLEVSEVTLANGLVFDDTKESASYLSDKLSTASEHIYVYDKENSVQEMSGPQIQTAISLLTSSKLDKDDALRAIISSVNAANTINAAAIAAGHISGGFSSSSSSK